MGEGGRLGYWGRVAYALFKTKFPFNCHLWVLTFIRLYTAKKKHKTSFGLVCRDPKEWTNKK